MRKERRHLITENRRLEREFLSTSRYVFPNLDCTPKLGFNVPDMLLAAFLIAVAAACLAVR